MRRFTVTATLEVPDECDAQDVARYAVDALMSWRGALHGGGCWDPDPMHYSSVVGSAEAREVGAGEESAARAGQRVHRRPERRRCGCNGRGRHRRECAVGLAERALKDAQQVLKDGGARG